MIVSNAIRPPQDSGIFIGLRPCNYHFIVDYPYNDSSLITIKLGLELLNFVPTFCDSPSYNVIRTRLIHTENGIGTSKGNLPYSFQFRKGGDWIRSYNQTTLDSIVSIVDSAQDIDRTYFISEGCGDYDSIVLSYRYEIYEPISRHNLICDDSYLLSFPVD